MFRTGNRVLARHRDTFIGYWLLVPAFLVMGAILIWRSIHHVVLSLFDFRLTRRDERVSVGFDNYTRLFFHDSLFHRAFVNTAVFVALALTLIPILWMIATSLKSQAQMIASPPLVIFTPTFENYLGQPVVPDGCGATS